MNNSPERESPSSLNAGNDVEFYQETVSVLARERIRLCFEQCHNIVEKDTGFNDEHLQGLSKKSQEFFILSEVMNGLIFI